MSLPLESAFESHSPDHWQACCSLPLAAAWVPGRACSVGLRLLGSVQVTEEDDSLTRTCDQRLQWPGAEAAAGTEVSGPRLAEPWATGTCSSLIFRHTPRSCILGLKAAFRRSFNNHDCWETGMNSIPGHTTTAHQHANASGSKVGFELATDCSTCWDGASMVKLIWFCLICLGRKVFIPSTRVAAEPLLMKLHALSITRWKHENESIKEPVHLFYSVDLSQLSFFQVCFVMIFGQCSGEFLFLICCSLDDSEELWRRLQVLRNLCLGVWFIEPVRVLTCRAALVLRTCVAKTNPGDYQRLEHEGIVVSNYGWNESRIGLKSWDRAFVEAIEFQEITYTSSADTLELLAYVLQIQSIHSASHFRS